MDATFKIWETNRNLYLKFIESFSLEQLNKIPEGFSNNLLWNLGHIIVSQQGLVYRLSGLPMSVTPEMMDKYKNGSKPTEFINEEEVNELKTLLFSLIKKTRVDYANALFNTYNEYTTSIGFNLKTSEEAMEFNNYHEAIHLGIMMQIKKFL